MDNDKIIGNREHLYDDRIIYDESHLPKQIKAYIAELKKYDEEKDWFHYDLKFDEFEVMLRICLNNHGITEYDYKKLTMKYGWLYD